MDYKELYFNWLLNKIDNGRLNEYSYLLSLLFDYPFKPIIDMDYNRSEDGKSLRYAYTREEIIDDLPSVVRKYIDKDYCSILELMIGVSIRIEGYMEDEEHDCRINEWFWDMIGSLGLIRQTNDKFNKELIEDILERFNNRDYEPDGEGSLFTIVDSDKDMRDIEIWYQMCSYINSIL